MQTIQEHFRDAGRDPTDVELETLAQTWSEHCSHKTLKGTIEFPTGRRIRQPAEGDDLRRDAGDSPAARRRTTGASASSRTTPASCASTTSITSASRWRRTTTRRPSSPTAAPTPAWAASSATRWAPASGAKPICNTDVFCFAPPDTPPEALPPGVLHPLKVMKGVVAGVRDYGNRMGIPTVNGAVCFDERYLGNPLVFCGTVGLIPVDRCQKAAQAGRPDRGGRRPHRPRRHPRGDVLLGRADGGVGEGQRRRGADRQRHRREEAAGRAAAGPRRGLVSRHHRLRRRRLQLRGRRDGRDAGRGGASWTRRR